jgi:DNA-binding PadR family transcriptional regulator
MGESWKGLEARLTPVLLRCKTEGVPSPHPRLLTLSPKELLVLELLLRHQDLYGLQLVATSGGRLKRGTVYVTLARMEEKGYVTSKLDAAPSGMGGLPRRLYAATPLGRRMFAAWTSGAKHLMPEAAR